jgi:hypothetical protein
MDQLQHQLKLLVIAFCLAAAACGSDGGSRRAEASTHVDSVLPREVELARFRAGLVEPAGLSGGERSRDALVRRFLTALGRRDTSALAALLLTRAEFAYLYYPSHPESQPPYNLSPGLMWFMIEARSEQGLRNALEARGGRPEEYGGYTCARSERQRENTVWTGCLVRRAQAPGDTVAELLFGLIIERGGRYKFVSYANKL